jgi:DNA-binding MarR family transcriptional regulator
MTREIRRYRKALRQFERLIGAQLKNCCSSVTLAQCLVLLDIDESGQLTMGQLASHLRLDHSTLSRTVDGLVQKELVTRLQDDSDRRRVWIQLTADGVSHCREIHRSNDAYCSRVLESIPLSDRGAVIRNFETLVQAYLDCEVEAEGCGSPEPPRRPARTPRRPPPHS